MLKGKDIDKIAAACNRYPVMNLTCDLGAKDEEEVELRVTLAREDELENELENELVLSNFFPGDKEEFWWVIVGDKKSNKVLATKRTLVK